MSNYRRGRLREYHAKWVLEQMGYHVTRAASSQGLADLVAVRGDEWLMVQCKLTSKDRYHEDANIQLLRDLPVPVNTRKELWVFKDGKGLTEVRNLKLDKPTVRHAAGQQQIIVGENAAQAIRERFPMSHFRKHPRRPPEP